MSEYSFNAPSLAAAHIEFDWGPLERSTDRHCFRKATRIRSIVNSIISPSCLPFDTIHLAPTRHIKPCRRLLVAIPNKVGLDTFRHSLERRPHIHINLRHRPHCHKIEQAHHFPSHKPHPRIGRYIIPSPSLKLIF